MTFNLGIGRIVCPFLLYLHADYLPCIHVYYRPVTDAGERVTPSNLVEYRREHDFKGPCCLCASLDPNENAYTEASIFLAKSGPSAGKYVAACATGLCRYWGESILNIWVRVL
jgi:hypothetical protein